MLVKQFKVAAISQNRGDFGHNQVILLAQDGEAWKVHHIQSNGEWKKDQILSISRAGAGYNWGAIGVECPEEMPKAPKKVIKEIWE